MTTLRFFLIVLVLCFFFPMAVQSQTEGDVALADSEKKAEAVAVGDSLGGRTETEITTAVMKYVEQLKHLYNMELREQPKLAGKIVVSFDIASNGEVIKVRLVSSNMKKPELEKKMLAEIKGWKFKKSEEGPPWTVEYPFVFSPQE